MNKIHYNSRRNTTTKSAAFFIFQHHVAVPLAREEAASLFDDYK
ncbi:MAG: hypothetical protein ABI383_14165 [Acidobacteriaceae bacterium]